MRQPKKIQREVRAPRMSALVSHRSFMRVGLSASVFAWIFIMQYFYVRSMSLRSAILGVALTFALTQCVTLLFTPVAAQSLRNGTKHGIAQGVVLAILGFTALSLALGGHLGTHVGIGVLGFAVCMGLYRACYWTPYEVDAARIPRTRSSQNALREMLFAFIPGCIGVVLSFGFPTPVLVVVFSTFAFILSLIPLYSVSDTREGFSWGYQRTFHELFTSHHRALVCAAIADGLSGAALLLFWPIAAFLIVGWSYEMLGIILTLTFLSVLVLRDFVRAILKTIGVAESVAVQVTLAASGWVMRLFVASPLSIVLVDSYYYAGTPTKRVGVDPFSFEQSADNGTYVDEYTALKEIDLAVGKISACLIATALLFVASVPITS